MSLLRALSPLWRCLRLLCMLGLLTVGGLGIAQTNGGAGKNFDHLRTGYPLTGQHAQQRCESCHVNGLFKGTPRTCDSCHSAGSRLSRGNVVMPPRHYPTSQTCDTCHDTKGFAGAKFNHAGVQNGTCQTCHTGSMAVGKPTNHIQTQASCDSCHRTTSWTLAGGGFDHAGVVAGTCLNCHDGRKATGKSAAHIPVGVTQSCDECHRGFSAWRPSAFNHTQVAALGACATCHSGGYPPADGRNAAHIPYQAIAVTAAANCDTCHKAGFTAWAPARFHANASVNAQCATCHTGSFSKAVGKPNTPIHAGVTTCETCHDKTTDWSTGKVDHAAFGAATNCASCHGVTAGGKSATHIPTTANCFTCHSTALWKPAKWNHSQIAVVGQCSTCHTGAYLPAVGKPANHIPYANVAAFTAANCDTCHKAGFGTWAGGRLHINGSVTTGCINCHNGTFLNAVGKPATTIHTGVTVCETCHTSNSSWTTTKVDHSGFNATTNCVSCHGVNASGKTANHIPTALGCFTCHSVVSWTPTKWSHTQFSVAGQCATCHTGGYPPADGKSATHVPYQSVTATAAANCDACHKAGFAAWAPAKVHANFPGITTQCAACHTGGFPPAGGKPADPIHATTAGCETCHSGSTTWTTGKVDHASFNATTTCATCHGATPAAVGKSATHIPTALNCFACHNVTTWRPSSWNHTQSTVAGQCASCHTGGYPPADGKAVNHIPYQSIALMASANCDACHKGSTTSWANGKLHANFVVTTGCTSCHTGAFQNAVGKPADTIHASVTGGCESCHTDTSNWKNAKVDHSKFSSATNCADCHGAVPAATPKPVSHMPTSVNCFACHNVTTWKPTKWNHTQQTVIGQCATCHTGGYAPADGMTANHIPFKSITGLASTNCDACHKGGFATWANGKFHANFTAPAGSCATCHTGAFQAAVGKSATTHIPTSLDCGSCHTATSWKPSTWAHTQQVVTAQCATCHTGGFPPADGRPGNHIPYASVSVASAANCDACHKGSFVTWANGKFHANYTVSTGCVTCHTLTASFQAAAGMPNSVTHTGVTGNCEKCHTSTASWGQATVDHAAFNTTTNCAQCHGVTTGGKNTTHIPTTLNCLTCHAVAPAKWKPTKWNHTQQTVTAQCATCHTGGYAPADGKPANHIPHATLANTGSCDACHKGGFATWANGKLHANVVVTANCGSCHTGAFQGASAKPASHMPVTADCSACHNAAGWKPSSWNHTQQATAAQCDTCHTGGYAPADGKPTNHVPYQSITVSNAAKCDACHKGGFATWANGVYHANFAVTANCASCHTGGFQGAVGKPADAIHATLTSGCETCHTGTVTWSGAKVNHSGFTAATDCTSCHGKTPSAVGKPATHMPTTLGCFTCHNLSPAGWKPTKWNHLQQVVTAQCDTCHSGGYPPADAKPANHIPYVQVTAAASAKCDACHKGSFTTWANGKFHSNFAGIVTGCFGCHTGAFQSAVGKPNTVTHASVTGNCEACHTSTTDWNTAKVDHSGYTAATNCALCHGVTTKAVGKPAAHVPTTANCFTCHAVSPTPWKPSKWNHTQVPVTGACATCHTGGYPPADGKPGNHVPYQNITVSAAANCDACHKGSVTTWANGKYHANFSVTASCNTCHNGAYLGASAKSTNHIGTTLDCSSCHTAAAWKPTSWNHTQQPVTAQCATCHSGGNPPADGVPITHIAYKTVPVSAAANCDACHKGGFTTWANGKFHTNYTVSTGCATCHNTNTVLGATPRPNNTQHASVNTGCEGCHKTTANWGASAADHSSFNTTTVCTQCHGVNASGKSATHIPTATNCIACHAVFPAKWTSTTFAHTNGTQGTITANCASCHTGGYAPADGAPTNHVPYKNVTQMANANCDACHKGNFTSWANGKVHANYTVTTGCNTCHTGNYMGATIKSATTHIPTTLDCSSCHNATNWKPSTWNHLQQTTAALCDTCHNGNYPPADAKPTNHPPYQSVGVSAAAKCDACHKGGFTTWANGKFHANFTVSTGCNTCHAGAFMGVTVKGGTHIQTTLDCSSCHNSVTVWKPSTWNHTQQVVTAQCATCHSGGNPPADGVPITHIAYKTVPVSAAANCDACHKGGFTTWANGKFHTNYTVSTGCATCHNTNTVLGATPRPNNTQHASVNTGCEGCHKTTANWGASAADHSSFNTTTVCTQCHGVNASGKNATHIPTATNCIACHAVFPAKWTSTTFAHTNGTQGTITANCDSCHTGGYAPADGPGANHIPYKSVTVASAAKCDACHKGGFTTWANGKFHANFTVSTGCNTCHAGAFMGVTVKGGAHIQTTLDCSSCHNSVTVWRPSTWNHTQQVVTAQCDTCHSGGNPPADGPVPNHILYKTIAVSAAAKCDACHKGGFTTWANGKFHSNFTVTTSCATCHLGGSAGATGKPNNTQHTGIVSGCEGCHKTTANWSASGADHSTFNATTVCTQCHGVNASGKHATHIPTTINCIACHAVSPSRWTSTTFAHTNGTQGTITANCDSCHTGGYAPADGKPANHVPYATVAVMAAAKCDACHKGSFTTWANGKIHTNYTVTTGCKSCHSGTYLGARGMPTNHIPHTTQLLNGAAMECNACHTSTAAWTTFTMNHNNSQGNGSGWCKGCHLSGTSYLGPLQRKSLTHERSTGVTDCSQSGCHRPLGNKGTAYRNWD